MALATLQETTIISQIDRVVKRLFSIELSETTFEFEIPLFRKGKLLGVRIETSATAYDFKLRTRPEMSNPSRYELIEKTNVNKVFFVSNLNIYFETPDRLLYASLKKVGVPFTGEALLDIITQTF